MIFLRSLLIVAFLTIVACTTFTSSTSNGIKELKFLGDVNMSSDSAFQGTLIGGLSGITYDQKRNRLLAISDDRGEYGEPRYYEFRVELKPGKLEITPVQIQPLKSMNGKKYKVGSIDFEGITLLPSGNLLISSEGDERPKKRIMPALSEYTTDGKWLKEWPIDDQFLFEKEGKITRGIRFNQGFESLTTTLAGDYTFTANENTLLQDGPVATEENKGILRLVRYDQQMKAEEFAYDLEAIPNPQGFEKLEGDTGLVDMVAFDKMNLITMERSWVKNNYKNTIRLYSVSLKNATAVQSIPSLAQSDVKRVHKTPLLDLDTITDKLTKNWQKLDNLEGITFGPTLPNGHKTLILVSDNNFSKHQRTLFVAFEIIPN